MPTDPAYELLFTEEVDSDTDQDMVEEMYWSMIQRHPLHILDQAASKNLYCEPEGEPSYTTVDPPIPIHIKLDPEEEILDKYGYDRIRDAVIWFSSKILRDRSIQPKVGDRVDFVYLNEAGGTVVEHLEIHEISSWDFARQAKIPYQITVAADRTHKSKKP